MKTCEVEGCEGKHEAKGLCQKHYDAKRNADPEVKRRRKERFVEYYSDPENRRREKERQAKYRAVPENRQRARERNAKRHADPEKKQQIKEYNYEYNQKNKERLVKYRADPEVKRRRKEYSDKFYAAPNNKQRKKDYDIKYWNDPNNKQRKKDYDIKYYAENHGYTGGAGHQPDAPNYVYIVANDELGAAKVGIGTRGRVAAHTSKGWEVVYLSPLMTKQDALKLERAIIGFQGVGGVVPGRHLTKEEMPDGYTETFDLRELDAVIGIMPILCGESDRIDQEQREAG